MNNIICPVCKKELQKYDNSCKCPNNHSYDIAKEGYVNLLLSNQKNSKNPGDNKEMMIARRDFLNAGYYNELLNTIIHTIKNIVIDQGVIVEAGCGEGFYISNIKNRLPMISAYGFDISKDAIKMASKRNDSVNFFVASSYNSCIMEKSVDVLLVVFAPFAEDEFYNILNDYGTIIVVKPKSEHLLELKNEFYDEIKTTKQEIYKKFSIYKTLNVSYRIFPDNNDVQNLFKMTPFYYQVNEKRAKINDFNAKNGIKVDFLVEVLKKMKI